MVAAGLVVASWQAGCRKETAQKPTPPAPVAAPPPPAKAVAPPAAPRRQQPPAEAPSAEQVPGDTEMRPALAPVFAAIGECIKAEQPAYDKPRQLRVTLLPSGQAAAVDLEGPV